MAVKKGGLGRGLDSLFNENATDNDGVVTVRLSEAPSYGCPIQYYDKRSKGCIAYNDLAKEFLKRNRRG